MNVLSLFDGISCGRIALERAGIKINKYFASEINKDAIKVSLKNYKDIIQLGDVNKIDCSTLPKIDLLIGGSPCQDLSLAKVKGQGLYGEKSGLFFQFVRILNETKPDYFLFENVKMKEEWKNIITTTLQVEPKEINSSLVSAQNRIRLYWTNIPFNEMPKNKGLKIKDIIYDDNHKVFSDKRIDNTRKFTKNYIKWDLSGKGYWSQQDRAYFKNGKMCTIPRARAITKLNIWLGENKYRNCHPIEAERLQTIPDNYTAIIKSPNKRMCLVGDGWTVDIIKHILKPIAKELQEKD